MAKVFLTIVNMSFVGAFVIAVICIARLPLKKVPKIISYCLWVVVAFRLICPIAIESSFSLIPYSGDAVQMPIRDDPVSNSVIDADVSFMAALEAAYYAVGDTLNGGLGIITVDTDSTPEGYTQAFHSEVWIIFGSYIWSFGVAILLIYGFVSYFLLKRKMRGAAHIENNIYEADNIKSPFVLGIFKPKIYLPLGLSEKERGYIMLHEQTHIRRHDHIVKFVAYFVLCLHWFNPLVWVAFILMGADMEMSCDERVLKDIGDDVKKDYSLSLLSLATEKRSIGGSPLAFGEGGVKERIKNVLNFKKPSRVIVFSAIVLLAVLSVGFAMNRIDKINNQFPMNGINLSDLQTDDIIQRVVQITGAKNGKVFVPSDNNFSIQVTENFDWQLGGTISFLFSKNRFGTERAYSSQLRIMANNNEFFVTSADIREIPENQYYLKDYLDALKYLPQDYIRSIVRENPDMYDIVFRDVDYINDELPKVFYSRNGLINDNVDNWTIMFDVYPSYHSEGMSGYTSLGSDTVRLYYVAEAPRVFVLENPNDEFYWTLSSITLYADGRAEFNMPVISSYTLVDTPLFYSFTDDVLEIQYEDGSMVARFRVIDENTLTYWESNVPIYADYGARYVYTPNPPPVPDILIPQIMVDGIIYYYDGNGQMNTEFELMESTPRIQSWILETLAPQENGQVNFDVELGAPYVRYNGGIAVLWNNEWRFFVTLDTFTSNVISPDVRMTIDDVRGLAAKGEALTVADFDLYHAESTNETSAYAPTFIIDDGSYILHILGSNVYDNVAFQIILTRADDIGNNTGGIDIRYYDVDKYVRDGTREFVRTNESPVAINASITNDVVLSTYITDDELSRVVLLENNRFSAVGRPEINYIPTGSYEIDGNKLYLNVSENQQFVFSIYENNLIFESGEWLENWIAKETVFTLLKDEQ